MSNTNNNEKTIYALIYDKAKAKQLCDDCDKKFTEDFAEYVSEAKADCKKYKIGFIISLTICVVSLVLAISHKINPCPPVISIVSAAFSFLVLLVSCFLIIGIKEGVASRSEDLAHNFRDYAYPNLGKVYKAVGDGEILSVEISENKNTDYDTCTINYKTQDNRPGKIWFFMETEKSFDVTEIEVDLIENTVRHPISINERNFKLIPESSVKEAGEAE